MLLDIWWKVVIFNVSRTVPWSEEAHFTEVSIVGEVEIGTETQNFAVEDDSTGIVSAISVENRKTNGGYKISN